MSEFIHVDESDANALAARKDDEQGSFLSMYRSLSMQHIDMDEFLVRGAVDCGVIPASIRYGVMRRGRMEAYRGTVKSTSGDLWYFSYAPNADFKLVKATEPAQIFEASKLLKTCPYGCDLAKGTAKAPLDPGETVEEASLEGTEFDDDKKDETEKGAVPIPSAATVNRTEDQSIQEQPRLQTDVHPGNTAAQMPEDETTGRNWHEPITRSQQPQLFTRAGDGLAPLATNDGEKHWSAVDLLKSYGQQLQATAPRVAPPVSSLEQQFLQDAMGVTPEQIAKGIRLAPRHRAAFEQWKAARLRERLNGLRDYIGRP